MGKIKSKSRHTPKNIKTRDSINQTTEHKCSTVLQNFRQAKCPPLYFKEPRPLLCYVCLCHVLWDVVKRKDFEVNGKENTSVYHDHLMHNSE